MHTRNTVIKDRTQESGSKNEIVAKKTYMRFREHLAKFATESSLFNSRRSQRMLVKFCSRLPDSFKYYRYQTVVTFAMTTEEKNVSHAKFAELFGIVRERFGLEQLPNFREEIGKNYLLKTRSASYQYLRDFYFGDQIDCLMLVTKISGVSYHLVCLFLKGNVLCTIGEQKIVYTDLQGCPSKMPERMRLGLECICVDLERVSETGQTGHEGQNCPVSLPAAVVSQN
jgi:acyl-CoA thioesterase FadM